LDGSPVIIKYKYGIRAFSKQWNSKSYWIGIQKPAVSYDAVNSNQELALKACIDL
jgi:hypothetical protein